MSFAYLEDFLCLSVWGHSLTLEGGAVQSPVGRSEVSVKVPGAIFNHWGVRVGVPVPQLIPQRGRFEACTCRLSESPQRDEAPIAHNWNLLFNICFTGSPLSPSPLPTPSCGPEYTTGTQILALESASAFEGIQLKELHSLWMFLGHLEEKTSPLYSPPLPTKLVLGMLSSSTV